MFDEDEILKLDEKYSFDVSVRDDNKRFAGKLTLSPEKCTLRVMGERQTSYSFYESSQIECSTFDKSFTLFELSINYQSSQSLRTSVDDNVGFFEYEFDVGFVICSDEDFNLNQNAAGFTIDSPMIKKWIGYTNKQQELIDKYHGQKLSLFSEDTLEFTHLLEGYGIIMAFYQLETHSNVLSFSSGIRFPPKLSIEFGSPKPISELHNEFKKSYDLMTLFVGADFKIDAIEVSTGSHSFSSKTCVYFTSNNKTYEPDYPVLPLSHNLRFNDLPLPELPLESFGNYYNLSEAERSVFSRYLRYKRMKSDEERFLGYFRLLEKLTYKTKSYVKSESLEVILKKSESYLAKRLQGNKKNIKSLISRISRLNDSKYNTEKCIGDFYESLPSSLKDGMFYNKSDLQKICKLRNDITHANDYIIDNEKLSKYTSFINVLLYLALLNKIRISPEVSASVAHRLDRYHLVQKFD
ncbi:HEPN domain-containing protein [Psychromonas ossibalaenae]|uniref:ApeA N-terminal domain 1-containing protein n=1 Tax=Psychromonas ossibalaenae TaxID=444922 RepID=UPI000378B850|nr:HEPN domain-containing protein [Psychromonas ossibalaenae]